MGTAINHNINAKNKILGCKEYIDLRLICEPIKNNPSNKNILLNNLILVRDCSFKSKSVPKITEIVKNNTKNGNLAFESLFLNL